MVIHKNSALQYLAIYLSIQFLNGRLQMAVDSDVFMGACLLFCGIYLLIHFRSLNDDSSFFFIIISLLVLGSCTIFLTMGGLSLASTLSLIIRLLIVYIAVTINREKFMERFLKLCVVFSLISILIFAFVQILGLDAAKVLFESLPLYEIKSSKSWFDSSYGLLLFCYNFRNGDRNSYMFGEPGLYQMLIVLALYFILFKEDKMEKRVKRNYIIIFIITLFTIQSTTGFMNLLVLIVCVMLSNNENINKNIRILIATGCVVGVVYFLLFAEGDNIIYIRVLSKITNASGELDFTVSSGADRMSSILALGKIAKSNPMDIICGCGYSGLVSHIGQFSCSGIVNTFIMFGIGFCLLLYGKMLINIITYSKDIFEIIFLIFMVVNNGLSQPDLLAITSVYAVFYSQLVKRKELSLDETYI